MESVNLQYGDTHFVFEAPEGALLRAPLVALADPQSLLEQAFDRPYGGRRLEECVRPGESVVIITSDITRYTASELYLPLLVQRLNRIGIPDADIEIIIALGIHRKQTDAEHKKILGSLFGRIRVSDHECDDPEKLVKLGTTSSGLPVEINRRVVEADRVIVTGTVGLHYFAGFGGGRKGVVPGVASRKTCMATHYAIFNPPQIGGRHPKATTGNLQGNPIHAAMLEAAQMIQPDFLFNTVLSPNKQIIGAFAGDLEQAHAAACELARTSSTVPLEIPCDLAIISCGGDPKDINFIQAHKALDYGVNALREGGTAILLAACPDGFGNPTFFDWFRYHDLKEFEAALHSRYEINGQTAYATRDKTSRYRVIMISNLTAEQTRQMGMEKAQTLDAALEMAYEKLPAAARTVVIPDGGAILPVITPA
ncbi:MAG: nickel-dependent lactate racemase [Desulfuromonadales bacterium]|nr:nickel-dependent lactate racemase [Desulfuromonadales bacterium]